MINMIWDAESFTKEFEKFENSIYDNQTMPSVFKKQIETINKLVDHWKVCPACALGFYCCQYETTFGEVWLNLIYHPQYHMCNGDYKLLFQKGGELCLKEM